MELSEFQVNVGQACVEQVAYVIAGSLAVVADVEDLRSYLKKSKGKSCASLSPAFIMDEYREYAGTQARRLEPDEVERYMSER